MKKIRSTMRLERYNTLIDECIINIFKENLNDKIQGNFSGSYNQMKLEKIFR